MKTLIQVLAPAIFMVSLPALAAPPEVKVEPGFEPNPKELGSFSSDVTLDAKKALGSTEACLTFRFISPEPLMVIDFQKPFTSMRIAVDNTAAAIARLPNNSFYCQPANSAGSAQLQLATVEGKLEMFSAQKQPGPVTSKVTIHDWPRTEAAEKAKSAAAEKIRDAVKELCKDDRNDGRNVFRLEDQPPPTSDSDLARGALQGVFCDEAGRHHGLRYAWRGMDDGRDSPIFPGVAVARCVHLEDSDYFSWRYCDLIDRRLGNPQWEAAYGPPLPELLRPGFIEKVERGRKRIAALRSKMEEHSQGYPKDKEKFDKALAIVKELEPAFPTLRADAKLVEKFMLKVKKGPGFAAGCAEQFRPPLQQRIAALVPKASGDLLRRALLSPEQHLLADVLAYCYGLLQENSLMAAALRGLVGQTPKVVGFHDSLWWSLDAVSRPLGYRLEEYPLYIAPSWGGASDPYGGGGGAAMQVYPNLEAVVTAVAKKGGKVQLSFKRTSGKVREFYDCKKGLITGIRWTSTGGEVERESHCQSREKTQDMTPAPILIPAEDGVAVKPGSFVGVFKSERSGPTLLWVKRNKDLVWLHGFSAN